MEYIQCTHCGKRYAASDKIKESEGQFVSCSACKEKFLMVVHDEADEPIIESDEAISMEGWDPSLTMPTESEETEDGISEETFGEQSLEDDNNGAEVLAELQKKRKKKMLLYVFAGLVFFMLSAVLYMTLTEEETVKDKVVMIGGIRSGIPFFS